MPTARSFLGGAHDRQPFLLGHGGDAVGGALVAGVAAHGSPTPAIDARCAMQDAGDVEQARKRGTGQARAAAAAVDLDEDGEGVAVHGRRSDRPGHGEVVGDDAQVDAAAAQLGDGR